MRPEAIEADVTPHDASTPPTARPATPQPAMASTVRRVNVFVLGSPSGPALWRGRGFRRGGRDALVLGGVLVQIGI